MCDVHKTERAVFSARLWSVQYPFESRLTSVWLKRSGVKRTVHGKFFLPYTVRPSCSIGMQWLRCRYVREAALQIAIFWTVHCYSVLRTNNCVTCVPVAVVNYTGDVMSRYEKILIDCTGRHALPLLDVHVHEIEGCGSWDSHGGLWPQVISDFWTKLSNGQLEFICAAPDSWLATCTYTSSHTCTYIHTYSSIGYLYSIAYIHTQ